MWPLVGLIGDLDGVGAIAEGEMSPEEAVQDDASTHTPKSTQDLVLLRGKETWPHFFTRSC